MQSTLIARLVGLSALIAAGITVIIALTNAAQGNAATSVACQGGDFRVVLPNGRVLSGYTGFKILPSELPPNGTLQVRGRYVSFDLNASTFAVSDYTLTGAANPLDMTGGVPTVLFAAKIPDLKGATLDSGQLEVSLSPQSAVLRRRGNGVGMKLQLKDCANGGIFQMEPDQQTVVTHVLGPTAFYFTNPLTGKINFGNGADVIGKDSPQVATKLSQLGNASVWRIEAGGRMGMVLGEDAIELAPGSPPCTHQCQVQDRVQGTFPVPGQ